MGDPHWKLSLDANLAHRHAGGFSHLDPRLERPNAPSLNGSPRLHAVKARSSPRNSPRNLPPIPGATSRGPPMGHVNRSPPQPNGQSYGRGPPPQQGTAMDGTAVTEVVHLMREMHTQMMQQDLQIHTLLQEVRWLRAHGPPPGFHPGPLQQPPQPHPPQQPRAAHASPHRLQHDERTRVTTELQQRQLAMDDLQRQIDQLERSGPRAQAPPQPQQLPQQAAPLVPLAAEAAEAAEVYAEAAEAAEAEEATEEVEEVEVVDVVDVADVVDVVEVDEAEEVEEIAETAETAGAAEAAEAADATAAAEGMMAEAERAAVETEVVMSVVGGKVSTWAVGLGDGPKPATEGATQADEVQQAAAELVDRVLAAAIAAGTGQPLEKFLQNNTPHLLSLVAPIDSAEHARARGPAAEPESLGDFLEDGCPRINIIAHGAAPPDDSEAATRRALSAAIEAAGGPIGGLELTLHDAPRSLDPHEHNRFDAVVKEGLKAIEARLGVGF